MTIRAATAPPLGRPFVVNRASSQAVGLIRWWPMRAGPMRDHAQTFAVATMTAMPFGGLFGGAGWQCNGSTSWADLGSTPSIPATGDFTLAVWAHSSGASGDSLFSQYIAVGSNGRILLRRSATATTQPELFLGSAAVLGNAFVFGPAFSTGMNHVVATRSGNTFTVYTNGVAGTPVTEASTRSILQTGNTVGAITGNAAGYNLAPITGFLTGGVMDIRIYNRALSAAEVWQLWAPQSRWDLYGVRVPRGRGAAAFFATMMQHHHAMLAGGRR